MNRLTSGKFQLASVAVILAAISPYLANVPGWAALTAVTVVVVAYMVLNVLQKKWGIDGDVMDYGYDDVSETDPETVQPLPTDPNEHP